MARLSNNDSLVVAYGDGFELMTLMSGAFDTVRDYKVDARGPIQDIAVHTRIDAEGREHLYILVVSTHRALFYRYTFGLNATLTFLSSYDSTEALRLGAIGYVHVTHQPEMRALVASDNKVISFAVPEHPVGMMFDSGTYAVKPGRHISSLAISTPSVNEPNGAVPLALVGSGKHATALRLEGVGVREAGDAEIGNVDGVIDGIGFRAPAVTGQIGAYVTFTNRVYEVTISPTDAVEAARSPAWNFNN
jgi:hypothetical protein